MRSRLMAVVRKETREVLRDPIYLVQAIVVPIVVTALAREKERGTIFNLYCSPISRWEVIVGKAIPYIALALFVYALLFALNIFVFEVRFVGSPLVLTAAALLYITASVGFGLLISVFCSTQVAAMLVTFIGLMTPSILFSGLMTPVSSMEPTAEFISRLIPASYFISMVRGVYLKGLGFRHFAPDLLTLGLFTAVVYGIAIAGFRKRAG